MFERMGVPTGINLDTLVAVAREGASLPGGTPGGSCTTGGPGSGSTCGGMYGYLFCGRIIRGSLIGSLPIVNERIDDPSYAPAPTPSQQGASIS